jgi:predicted DNA-binding transcriptional regulator AlpA
MAGTTPSAPLPPTAPAVLTLAETASVLGVTVATLRSWFNAGRFPRPMYLGPRSPRYRRVDIEAHLAKEAAHAS